MVRGHEKAANELKVLAKPKLAGKRQRKARS